MKNSHKISLQIGVFVFLFGVVFFIIALFWYGNYSSIRDFFENFWIEKNIYLLGCIFIFSVGIGFLAKMFIGQIFSEIEANNEKLRDYNHYLAHELKTPITIIHSYFERLRYEYDNDVLDKSQDELRNMTQIIDGLLELTESFQVQNTSEINLENFIKRCITNFPAVTSNMVVIENSQFNFSLTTDEVLLGRAIKNLLENGFKYSFDGTMKIQILEDKLVFINPIEENLSQQELENISRKFYTTAPKTHGTGLGISMISEIVKIMGYRLELSSKDKTFIAEIIW